MDNDKLNKWIELLKNDKDFDSEYLIKIINMKLESMLSCVGLEDSPENLDDRLYELARECLSLGKKILDYNYGEDADVYENSNKLSMSPDEFKKWSSLVSKSVKDRNSDIKKYFSMLGKLATKWW